MLSETLFVDWVVGSNNMTLEWKITHSPQLMCWFVVLLLDKSHNRHTMFEPSVPLCMTDYIAGGIKFTQVAIEVKACGPLSCQMNVVVVCWSLSPRRLITWCVSHLYSSDDTATTRVFWDDPISTGEIPLQRGFCQCTKFLQGVLNNSRMPRYFCFITTGRVPGIPSLCCRIPPGLLFFCIRSTGAPIFCPFWFAGSLIDFLHMPSKASYDHYFDIKYLLKLDQGRRLQNEFWSSSTTSRVPHTSSQGPTKSKTCIAFFLKGCSALKCNSRKEAHMGWYHRSRSSMHYKLFIRSTLCTQ